MKQKITMMMMAVLCNTAAWGAGQTPINFVDANVKALCVANWDTNGDGELSEDEAAAVTKLGTVFQNQAEITSFSEFRYFTGVTTIGEYELSGCSKLTTISFPKGLQTIMRYGCYNSGFMSIDIPESVTSIGNSAFRNCPALTDIRFGRGTVTFGKNLFRSCANLTRVTFDGTVCRFSGEDAFRACPALTSVVITDLSAWCNSTFSYSSSNPLSIAKSLSLLTADGNQTVITDLVIPGEITAINNFAFYMCESLQSVTIPSSVTSFGSWAFYGCIGLTDVTMGASEPVTIDTSVFPNCADITLHVPEGSKEAYMAADVWKNFKEIVAPLRDGDSFTATTAEGIAITYTVISEELKTCRVGYVYEKKKGMRTAIDKETTGAVNIPAVVNGYAVKGIGDYAFFECKNITSVALPDGLTHIGKSAFNFCQGLQSIVVPEGVTGFGESAFGNCTSAVTIDIPNSVKYGFGDYSFAGCTSLTSINIPEGISSIGSCAFSNCRSLRSVTLPSTVKTIYEFAFDGCTSLGSVTLSDNLQLIGTGAFSGSCITTLTLPSSFTTSYNLNNISYSGTHIGSIPTLKKVVISKGVEKLNEVFEYCSNIETVVCYNEVPPYAYNCWKLYRASVLYVPEGARDAYAADEYWKSFNIVELKPLQFADEHVKNVCVSNWDADGDGALDQLEVAEIQNLGQAFSNQSAIASFDELKYFTNLTAIGENAFSGCSGLTSIAIPASVKTIAGNAFAGCGNLNAVTVVSPTPCTLATNAFPGRAGATLYVPVGSKMAYSTADVWSEFKAIVEVDASVTNIVFADAAVKALCMATDGWDANGDGELSMAEAAAITDIGMTFHNKVIKSFEELQYFTGLTTIAENAFNVCSTLESIVLPPNITNIGNYAFVGCSNLTSIHIPSMVTTIGIGAFEGCSALTSMTIPSGVTAIGNGAFRGCSGLQTFVVEEGNAYYDSREHCNALIETATNTLLTGTAGTKIPDGITTIAGFAFNGVTGLTELTIPQSVTSIGNYAFYSCSDLASINLPDGINTIADNAFSCCTNLRSITIPSTVTTICQSAFQGCTSLTAITLPEGVTGLQYGAFSGCKALESVSIPSTISSMYDDVFKDCLNLISVTVYRKTPLTISSYGTFQYRANATLYVPYGCKAAYEAAAYWNEFKEIVEMENTTPTGDVNGDGIVNGLDIQEVINASAADSTDHLYDINGDGNIDALDIQEIINIGAASASRQSRF